MRFRTDERRRQQANLIYAWADGKQLDLRFYFINASPTPVTSVKVFAEVRYGLAEHRRIQVTQDVFRLDMLPPRGEKPLMVPLQDLFRFGREPWPADWRPLSAKVMSMSFTDSQGHEWERNLPGGELSTVGG
jgi:hypothetical protein